MIKWNAWDTLLADIKAQEVSVKSIEEQWRDLKYQEECESREEQRKQHAKSLDAI